MVARGHLRPPHPQYGPDAAVETCVRNATPWLPARGRAAGQRVERHLGQACDRGRGIAKTYEGRQIIAPFSTRILRGDRVGIIGPMVRANPR